MTTAVLATLFVSIANYYLTTFSIWFGHWFSHLKKGPLTAFHVSGHHVLYPNSQNMRSGAFLYASGKHDSNYALVPWLIVQAIMQSFFLPFPLFFMCLIQTTSISIITGYVHMNFHLQNSRLEAFRWFVQARSLHGLHHDLDMNYMVADHFWDRVFGTYTVNPAVSQIASRPITLRPKGSMWVTADSRKP
jgi:sterol desaturase/sphingolipid hydroxylase (fatty acid hydroxylase superfamily)